MMKQIFSILFAFCTLIPLPALAITSNDLHAVLNDTTFFDPNASDNGGGGNVPPPPGNPKGNVALGQQMAAQSPYNWTGSQWDCLYNLWQGESGWNELAENPSSGAYGIPQALPGDKMASVAPDWKTNAATQITWGLEYIQGRYRTPCNAYQLWLSRNPHWY